MSKVAGRISAKRYLKEFCPVQDKWIYHEVAVRAWDKVITSFGENGTRWREISKSEYPYTLN